MGTANACLHRAERSMTANYAAVEGRLSCCVDYICGCEGCPSLVQSRCAVPCATFALGMSVASGSAEVCWLGPCTPFCVKRRRCRFMQLPLLL